MSPPKTLLVATVALFVLTLVVPAASAQPSPRADERVLFEDPADQPHPAYDVVAVYLSEVFLFNADTRAPVGDAFKVRIQVDDMSSYPYNTVTRYYVFFEAGGEPFATWANVTRPCTSTANDACQEPRVPDDGAGPGTSASVGPQGVTLTIREDAFGLVPGDVLSSVWVATAVQGTVAEAWQDVAPRADDGSPHGIEAPGVPADAPDAFLIGAFAYVTATPQSPLSLNSVDGDQVRYQFAIASHEAFAGELVWVLFEPPEGWRVAPSHGAGGADTVGFISNLGPDPVRFGADVYAQQTPERGNVSVAQMHVISSSGAHQVHELRTEVTGPLIEDPAYGFELVGPARADEGETTTLLFQVVHDGEPLGGNFRVNVDVYRNGRFLGTEETEPKGNGTYLLQYDFQGEGEWRLDVFVANFRPAPHESFALHVSDDGIPGVPGVAVVAVLLALLATVRWRREA